MNLLNGLRVGRVLGREPTLEDAYVRLVGESQGANDIPSS
jgi:hypothetical protein